MQLDGSTVSWAIPKGLLGRFVLWASAARGAYIEVYQSEVRLADWQWKRLYTLSAILCSKVRADHRPLTMKLKLQAVMVVVRFHPRCSYNV